MNINVVIAGHVDHGKSTLIGRLLYDSDNIKEGRVDEIQKLAEEYKRGSSLLISWIHLMMS